MDRNGVDAPHLILQPVVPRKGDVDRNPAAARFCPGKDVVPRKGDVDRNVDHIGLLAPGDPVVPRKGDVDRNPKTPDAWLDGLGRPPQGGRG